MEDFSKNLDFQKVVSYADVLIEVLRNEKDSANLSELLEAASGLRSSCEADFIEVRNLIEEYEEKINACKQKIDEAKSGIVTDAELDEFQNELERELQSEKLLRQELRILSEEIDNLDNQRVSVEERKRKILKMEKEEIRAQSKLSMYASVTRIIPNLAEETRISGYIVNRDKKWLEKFEFDPALVSPFEICNNLWKMAGL